MQSVTIKTAALIERIKENRDKHAAEVARAKDGYLIELEKKLDQLLYDLRMSKRACRHIDLQEPIDRTEDYDRVLSMLAMSCEKQVTLSAHEFDQYVMDNWNWKAASIAINSTYGAVARR